jgi:hypothetical protein
MRRREFITLLGGTAVACPLAARSATVPVIGSQLTNAEASDQRGLRRAS